MPIARLIPPITALLLATACTAPSGPATPTWAPAVSPQSADTEALVARGRTLAEAQCSDCHAPGTGPSANPQAPSFAAVANEMDFTPTSLREFFVDGHDTPNMMTIRLDDEDADAMTAYILSLRTAR